MMRYTILFYLFFSFCSFQFNHLSNETEGLIEVYIFLEEDCRISQYYTKTLKELHEQYACDELVFKGVFPSQSTDQEDIEGFREKYDIPFDLYFDKQQVVTKKFEATITPEVVVYNATEDAILYKGRIDNSYFRVGKRRNVVTSFELEQVLKNISNDQTINTKWEAAIGCYIKLMK